MNYEQEFNASREHGVNVMRNEYAKYFGWDADRNCTVYLYNNEPVGCTPIDEALEIAIDATTPGVRVRNSND